MRTEVPTRVAARRIKLLADRNIQASIGFPIKRRATADTYSAGGEVFTCTGKTDILIREQDRHVFIAECKGDSA